LDISFLGQIPVAYLLSIGQNKCRALPVGLEEGEKHRFQRLCHPGGNGAVNHDLGEFHPYQFHLGSACGTTSTSCFSKRIQCNELMVAMLNQKKNTD
jgi:hypothetical protein